MDNACSVLYALHKNVWLLISYMVTASHPYALCILYFGKIVTYFVRLTSYTAIYFRTHEFRHPQTKTKNASHATGCTNLANLITQFAVCLHFLWTAVKLWLSIQTFLAWTVKWLLVLTQAEGISVIQVFSWGLRVSYTAFTYNGRRLGHGLRPRLCY